MAARSLSFRLIWVILAFSTSGLCGVTKEMDKKSGESDQVQTSASESVKSHPELRVAMIQMDVADGDLAENMKRAENGIRDAADQKADLVCLPEAADWGWLYQKARQDALPIPGAYTDRLSNLAKELKIWICGGCIEKDGDKTFNSAILIDRTGVIVLKHRKISTLPKLTAHLYDAGSAEDIKVVDTEFGRVGVTICADNFNVVHPQKVADQGAWLLLTPHGFAEKREDLLDNGVAFINHIKNVANKTKLWVIGTNTALSEIAGGDWKGYLHSGASTIADPAGKAKVIGEFLKPGLVIYDIPGASP